MRMQGLSGQRKVRFAEGFVLRRVCVDQGSDIVGQSFPPDDQLGLTDLLTHPRTDHVDADDGAVLDAHRLDRARRADDLALRVARQVVLGDRHSIAVRGPREGEQLETRQVRYRTVGDMSCTGAVESTASTPDEVLAEISISTLSERGATRADDKLSESAMEDRKKEGYF